MYLDLLSYLFLVMITFCCLQQTGFAAVIDSQSLEQKLSEKTEIIITTTTVILSYIPVTESSKSEETFWIPISSTPARETTTETPTETTTDSEISVEKHYTPTCTATMLHFPKFDLGPTKTIYPFTRTATVYIDCEGCDTLVTKNVGGHGPVVFITTAVRNVVPTTTTTFKCSRTLDVNSE